MLTFITKRLIIVFTLTIAAGFCAAQELPRDPHAATAKPPVTRHGHRAPVKSQKVKWLDSATINDEKLGHVKIDMKLFKAKAIEKTTELSNYITLLASKNTSRADKNKTVDQACKLFVNENATVEVSNATRSKVSKLDIRTYLTNLTYLSDHFEKVVVQYVDITYVPEFRKGVDGNYYSVVTFVQKFEGFVDGKLSYGDFTKKDITVVLKNYKKIDADGTTKNKWDVFLSDIGVKETVKMVNTFNK